MRRDGTGVDWTVYLYELSLFSTVSSLQSEGSVAIQRTGRLHPHLRLGVDTLGRHGVREAAPAGGQQDEDCVEVSPAIGGGVQHLAPLISHSVSITSQECQLSLFT